MAIPNSRTSLIQYCLRRLGDPVTEINIDDAQIDDCVDDAFQQYQEFNYDATERVYVKYTLTAEDLVNRYINIDDSIIGVRKVFPLSSSGFGAGGIFSATYQFILNDMHNLISGSLIDFNMSMRHLALMDQMFSKAPFVDFNRHQNRLSLNMTWNEAREGHIVLIECFKILDPDTFTKVYNDIWLKQYLTSLIKRQWATNLKKYGSITLPGGVTLDGQKLYDEAIGEIEALREEARSTYQLPASFIMG